jgi:DNA-directed RNA polymerase subunit N (RpoN/RPB10)
VLRKRIEKMQKELSPFDVTINHPQMGDVLDTLNIKKMCCRMHILSYRTKDNVIALLLGNGEFT